jgi:hypothetical protein
VAAYNYPGVIVNVVSLFRAADGGVEYRAAVRSYIQQKMESDETCLTHIL